MYASFILLKWSYTVNHYIAKKRELSNKVIPVTVNKKDVKILIYRELTEKDECP